MLCSDLRYSFDTQKIGISIDTGVRLTISVTKDNMLRIYRSVCVSLSPFHFWTLIHRDKSVTTLINYFGKYQNIRPVNKVISICLRVCVCVCVIAFKFVFYWKYVACVFVCVRVCICVCTCMCVVHVFTFQFSSAPDTSSRKSRTNH